MRVVASGEVPLWAALRVLQLANVILGERDRWTKDQYARNRDGEAAQPTDSDAASWCSVGAMRLAAHRLGGPEGLGVVGLDRCGVLDRIEHHALEPFIPYGHGLGTWNDFESTTWKDVRTVFTKAINYIEAKLDGTPQVIL